jgi:hypothetical protein
VKLAGKDSVEIMEIHSPERAGDVLVVKGQIMHSMPATIHLRPEDLWEALALFNWRLLIRLPLYKGFRRSRAKRTPPSGS